MAHPVPSLLSDNNCMISHQASERGASLAETALIITVVAIAAAIALSFLGSSSESSLDEAGKGIHRSPGGASSGGASVGGGPGGAGSGDPGGSGSPGGTGGGGTGWPGSTTTPTTTSIPATTTMAPTTTTWPTLAPATAVLGGGVGVRSGSSRWNASADLDLAADDAAGSMAGTATVLVESWRSNGQRSTQTIQVPIGPDGTAGIESGPYARTGSSRIETVRYTVVDIDLHNGRDWDGERPSITIGRPA
ncbi:MAG: hypothetical protein ACTHN0_15095 [Aquihabitans sp.]